MNSPMNRWVLAAALLCAAFLGVFWREIGESMGEGVASIIGGDKLETTLQDVEIGSISGVRFEPEVNNVFDLSMSDVRLERRAGQTAVVSGLLTNASPRNAYPHLRLTLFSRAGDVRRVVEFTSSEYEHGKQLVSERVSISFDRKEGEARFLLEPFYPKKGSAR